MNNIANIRFIYDTLADICLLKESHSIRELTIKGSCEYQGQINGTWFQIDELVSHWISFRRDKFRANKWEVFYKRISDEQTTYYRRIFFGIEGIIAFSFSEKGEWVKVEGKWRNKYLKTQT